MMKYALVLVFIALAITMPMISADKGKKDGKDKGGHEPEGGFVTCIQKLTSKNATVKAALITALNEASLSQYIVNGVVNFTALNQNLFTVAPALSDFFNNYIIPYYPKLGSTYTVTRTVIDYLQNDATNQTIFGGLLTFKKYFDFVNGTMPTLTVDYAGVQGNAGAAKVLTCHIENETRGILKPGSMGPFGKYGKEKHSF